MFEPKISVILPIYNVEKYLPRCMDSLLSQDFPDMELILVDDGSPDGCGAMCDDYAAADPRIRVIHKENGGQGLARNTGLEAARGKYISFIDPDDYIAEGTYSSLWNAALLDNEETDIVCFGYEKTRSGKVINRHTRPYEQGHYSGEALREIKLDTVSNRNVLDYEKTRILSVWSCLFRREFLMEHHLRFRSEREILNEDYLFLVHAMTAAKSVFMSRECYYFYDTRNGSTTRSPRPQMYERKQKLYDAYCEAVDVSDAEIQLRLRNFYIDCIYACFVEESTTAQPACDAISHIRRLLQDQKLQSCLRENRRLVCGKKNRIITFLMRKKMAAAMYYGYRAMKN